MALRNLKIYISFGKGNKEFKQIRKAQKPLKEKLKSMETCQAINNFLRKLWLMSLCLSFFYIFVGLNRFTMQTVFVIQEMQLLIWLV